MADADVLQSLQTTLTDHGYHVRHRDAHYNGAKRLQALGMSIPPEMRQLQVVVNWPRLYLDALEERIDLEGFRMQGAKLTDNRLWNWWQANNLDEESTMAHLECFVQGRAYVVVGFNEEDPETPIITCEGARSMYADIDPRTRKVTAAIRQYDYAEDGSPRAATLYLPDRTVYFRYDRDRWLQDGPSQDHNYGEVPVVPMLNRGRLSERNFGRSEMADIVDVSDAMCRAITNLQGAQETLAVPARFVFGITEDDLKDQDGNPVTKWEAYLGRYNTMSGSRGGQDGADVIQLPGADLRNFTEVFNSYASIVASLTGLPPHYLGLTTDNPASAEGMRAGETRIIKRAERKIRVLGGVWENTMRLGMRIVDGEVPEAARNMEARFRDPGTPTYAQKADAAVKLVGAGIIPKQAAWNDLGYSEEYQKYLTELGDNDAMAQLLKSVGGGNNLSNLGQ